MPLYIGIGDVDPRRVGRQAVEEGIMRTGGFPCRLLGCDRTFQVVDQKSMGSLKAASSARSDHEISVHSYHHVRLADEPSYRSYQRAKQKSAGSK